MIMLSGFRSVAAATTTPRAFRTPFQTRRIVTPCINRFHRTLCVTSSSAGVVNAFPPNRPASSYLYRCLSPTLYVGVRRFSASVEQDSTGQLSHYKSVRILYGSTQGTAQLFAMQLADELAESFPSVDDVTVAALNEAPPNEILTAGDDVANIVVASVTGVGEPPQNARDFYDWLHSPECEGVLRLAAPQYAVFGCGNLKAHPNNFNVIGKYFDKRLGECGAQRIHELGLGDDSGCIEDDYDNWMNSLIKTLSGETAEPKGAEETIIQDRQDHEVDQKLDGKGSGDQHELLPCDGAIAKFGTRLISRKYPKLKLHREDDGRYDVPREDLFFLEDTPTPFYQPGTKALPMVSNRALRSGGGEYIMHEMRVSLESVQEKSYETGDHLMVYPKNAQCVVDAYLGSVDAHGSSFIVGIDDAIGYDGKQRAYPHPMGVTVEETLMHCVDLGAPPSPSFARKLLGRKDVNYKEEVADPRRTAIELIKESGVSLSLEELLFNLPPMQARYYSISSSALADPREIHLTYRPIMYVTSRGCLREGVCTSYMKNLHPVMESGGNDVLARPHIAASIRSNPTFRLPKDDITPIILVAGGCGIAPIRSFVEERICRAEANRGPLGDTYLYLGFRSPKDEVYRSFFDRAVESGVVKEAHISYTKGCVTPEQNCGFVSETIRRNSKFVLDMLDGGAHMYLCGGARQFGAAIENVMLECIAEHKKLSFEGAEDYLRKVMKEGRLAEDLAD